MGVWAAGMVAVGARAVAQRPAADTVPAPAAAPTATPAWAAAPFVGYAARSPVRFWGLTPGRNHLMLGVQFVRPLARLGAFTLAYAPNVVPVFVLSNNPRAASPRVPTVFPPGTPPGVGEPELVSCEAVQCGPVYGFAAAPLGLRLEAQLLPRLGVYGAAAAGAVLFRRNVPVPEARRLNATAEWGGGATVRTGGGSAVQVGYKYHHLSNAYTAVRNPGVDGRVFYAGVQWRLRARPRHGDARP